MERPSEGAIAHPAWEVDDCDDVDAWESEAAYARGCRHPVQRAAEEALNHDVGTQLIPHGGNAAIALTADLQSAPATADTDLVEYKTELALHRRTAHRGVAPERALCEIAEPAKDTWRRPQKTLTRVLLEQRR